MVHNYKWLIISVFFINSRQAYLRAECRASACAIVLVAQCQASLHPRHAIVVTPLNALPPPVSTGLWHFFPNAFKPFTSTGAVTFFCPNVSKPPLIVLGLWHFFLNASKPPFISTGAVTFFCPNASKPFTSTGAVTFFCPNASKPFTSTGAVTFFLTECAHPSSH